MEKVIGKIVASDGVRAFASDFIEWAGEHTARAVLTDEASGMAIEIVAERNADQPLVLATGLAGGGQAVAMWAEGQGYVVVEADDEVVEVEVRPKKVPDVADGFATFLAPVGEWRVKDVHVRRKRT